MRLLVVNYFLIAFLVSLISQCKDQQSCYSLINKSKIELNHEAICDSLKNLKNNTIELSFYITDQIPDLVERDNIFLSSKRQLEKRSMVFIDFRTKEFDISYSHELKDQNYLRSRYDFMHKISENLNNKNKTEVIINTISDFNQIFTFRTDNN